MNTAEEHSCSLYLVFLVILGLPVMVMEFAVGRASQKSAAKAFDILEPKRRFHWFFVVGLYWLHAAYDVLHHRSRLDACLYPQDGNRNL